MPETKPDIFFDNDGICSACKNYNNRDSIDWTFRKNELNDIFERYRSKDSSNYDCIIPVSGGKDSTYQVIRVCEMGMNPLCVTATTDKLTDIGRRNIENIKNLGVDYIEISVNPIVRRRMNKLALKQVGDISWPEHITIFTIPIRIAVQMQIPLVVWGENSQNEYGGPAASAENNTLNRRWLEEFGGLLGLRASDLIGQENIEAKDLIQYQYPEDDELYRAGVTGIFLGYYIPWDGWANALISQAHGFESYSHLVEGSLASYENLDNAQTGIHDYFKFLKYGFSRATDIACIQIRRGRLSRSDAINLVKRHDGKFPHSYLGYSIDEILGDIDVSLEEFIQICDQFTNKKLFVTDRSGKLVRDKHGNLTKLNYDNPA